MCFKYEQEYDAGCWDYLAWGTWENCPKCRAEIHSTDAITRLLEQFYDVEFNNCDKFMDRLLRFFEGLHEEGIIRPKKGVQ